VEEMFIANAWSMFELSLVLLLYQGSIFLCAVPPGGRMWPAIWFQLARPSSLQLCNLC